MVAFAWIACELPLLLEGPFIEATMPPQIVIVWLELPLLLEGPFIEAFSFLMKGGEQNIAPPSGGALH
ncbi:Protein of unknown function [Propionibacterium freudenreichii]|nr:Protein of unknown function [Propionibacterium freudenreichii]